MTKLEAVNYLLGVLGSAPVGDLNNKNPDVATAVAALTAAISSVTGRGYWFNEVYNVTLTPDPITGNIATTGWKTLITRNIYGVIRGELLFNPKENTYVWDTDVVADGVALLDFELLPEAVQNAVQYWAGVQLCTVELEDTTKRGELQEFYNHAYLEIQRDERAIKRNNRLASPRVQEALHRVRPLRGRSGPNFGGR